MQVKCAGCGSSTKKWPYEVKMYATFYCSMKCRDITQVVECFNCKKTFRKKAKEIKNTKQNYCSRSCAAIQNNKNKRKSRRSKCEIGLQNMLQAEFPNLELLPNDKTILDGYEVDIFFPSINLAIEWNGIVHFKPIYGTEKLLNIQERDQQKLELATKKDVNLVIISDRVSTSAFISQSFNEIKPIIYSLLS